jgi:hypothetical protein
MSKLITLTDLNCDNFLEMLRESDIVIYENIQGSKIFFRFNDVDTVMKSRNIKNSPINRVDLAIQKFYNKAYNYLDEIDDRAKKLCPDNWWFCCEYFPDEQPSVLKYDKVPKNNLILTSIVKGDKHTFNLEEIYEFSNLLGIEPLPVLFYGKLTDNQIELLNYFLHTKQSDLEYIFGEDETNFSKFFYNILSPQIENSLLMDDGKFEENIDKLIIKFDNKDEICLALLNPLYTKNDDKNGQHIDNYTILLSDFLEFLQTIDIERRFINGVNSDELYLDFMCEIYNSYLESREDRILNFEFNVPPFFYKDKFKINIDLVSNQKTKYYLKKSNKLEYLFKIILSSFRYRKNKALGVFTDNTLRIFNEYVDTITRIIDRALRIEREDELSKHSLLDFGTFFNIKYPKDAEDKVYPDLYKNLEDETFIGDKKKKGIYTKKYKGE